MVLRIDSITTLRAFVAAADLQSFKLAGGALGVSSSAIGKAIARLEEQLATALFHRTTRTLSLTEEGALYLERARRALGELEEAEADLAHATGRPRGRLRVSLPLSASVLTPAMGAFMAAYPEIELDLDYNDRLVDVIGEGFDAVIRTGEPADSRLVSRKLADFRWLLVAAPSYLDRAGTPASPDALPGHVCLRQRLSSGKLLNWPLRNAANLPIPSSLTASIIDPLIDLAVMEAGIVAAPRFLVRSHLADGRLVPLLGEELERSGTLNLLWPSGRFRTPRVRALVEFLVGWARQEHWCD